MHLQGTNRYCNLILSWLTEWSLSFSTAARWQALRGGEKQQIHTVLEQLILLRGEANLNYSFRLRVLSFQALCSCFHPPAPYKGRANGSLPGSHDSLEHRRALHPTRDPVAQTSPIDKPVINNRFLPFERIMFWTGCISTADWEINSGLEMFWTLLALHFKYESDFVRVRLACYF